MLLKEILTVPKRECKLRFPSMLFVVGVGEAEASAGPSLGGADRPSVQGRIGEHYAALRSESIWHYGRNSGTECQVKSMSYNTTQFYELKI